MSVLYIALAHHPVLNKAGETVTTSISNLDIHDIARAAETYGVKAYYIVHTDPRPAGTAQQHQKLLAGSGIAL